MQSQKQIIAYNLVPGTFAARLDIIKWFFVDAQKAIREEIVKAPQTQRARLRFLRSLERRAELLEMRCEDYGQGLGREEGLVAVEQ